MISRKENIQDIATARRMEAVKIYTDSALLNPDLTPAEKIKLANLNQHNRLSIIKRIQRHTLEHLFLKKPDVFFTKSYHYDWWVFPMHVPIEWNWPSRNYDASIDLDEAKILLYDGEFVKTYLSCVSMYVEALKTHGWNDYPVRYARMLQSMSLFINAARHIKNEFDDYELICNQAELAVDYAAKHVIANYPDYPLLIDGFNKTMDELSRCNEILVLHK